jgi:hypothetical protein
MNQVLLYLFHIGVQQRLAMDPLVLYPGPPCPTLLCSVGGPSLEWPYSRFRGGHSWDGWPAAVFYPFGHPTPYAHAYFITIRLTFPLLLPASLDATIGSILVLNIFSLQNFIPFSSSQLRLFTSAENPFAYFGRVIFFLYHYFRSQQKIMVQ